MRLHEILSKIGLTIDVNDIEINGLNTLTMATKSDISFFENKKYTQQLQETKAAAVFVKEEFASLVPSNTIALITDMPYMFMAKATAFFVKPLVLKEGKETTLGDNVFVMPNVYIGKEGSIGENTQILSSAYIGDRVTIGKNTIIYPNVTILNDVKIGDNCIIHPGAVIGSDGFGFAQDKMGRGVKIYHLGDVVIENDVEVGANTTIDRAVYGTTLIKEGTKLDNLIQIAHNAEVGKHCFLAAQSAFAGSSKLGDHIFAGAQVGVAGHLEVGSFSMLAARTGITKTLPSGKWAGFPAIPHKDWLKKEAKVNRLLAKD